MMGLDTPETCRSGSNILTYNLCIKLVFLYTIANQRYVVSQKNDDLTFSLHTACVHILIIES